MALYPFVACHLKSRNSKRERKLQCQKKNLKKCIKLSPHCFYSHILKTSLRRNTKLKNCVYDAIILLSVYTTPLPPPPLYSLLLLFLLLRPPSSSYSLSTSPFYLKTYSLLYVFLFSECGCENLQAGAFSVGSLQDPRAASSCGNLGRRLKPGCHL